MDLPAQSVRGTAPPLPPMEALRSHWREYAFEGLGLGLFMVSACLFDSLLEYPASPAHVALPDPRVRRVLMGIAMGATAIALIYSPWGKRSGAHINPAVTLTFFRLGRVQRWDAFFYVLAQFAGGAAGVLLSTWIARDIVTDPSVKYVVTVPGDAGWGAAAAGEFLISFCLMLVVLAVGGSRRWAPYTGLCAGVLVAGYIAFEAPYSGMSMNPARTAASAVVAHVWTAWWIYFAIPPAAMVLAAEFYVRRAGRGRVPCAKLHHSNKVRCIFCHFLPSSKAVP
jgi:aquaporin Z